MRCSVATGTNAMSSKSMPIDCPFDSSTPITRSRHCAIRTDLPSGLSPRNTSRSMVRPITTTFSPWWGSLGGQEPPARDRQVPDLGVRRGGAGDVDRARAAAVLELAAAERQRRHLSRGARLPADRLRVVDGEVARRAPAVGIPPLVSTRPGSVITRLVPRPENSRTT